ncbi:ubiquitin-associated protein 1-like isoform X2 [Actinia tenebrosa]|uniref:Ubiquitin-associated protein 1-like isoform X2 n=1 Tax=Actinia tenebrosa TaxID=6105 RepID=A0A6P8I955_ACTTE|nr:ubiquitin-associated protein 1-like isoform X2 [Actinia tenebrosa]
MDFKHKTFRKCGSHYSDLGALDGVEVKIGQNFQPPRKVALPVGFQQNDPSEVLNLTYDFALENEIISKVEELKAKQLQQKEEEEEARQDAAALAEETVSATTSSSTRNISISTGQEIFSTVGTDILQPTTCTTVGHKRNESLGKNPFDLSDFEAQDSNPFELVELQTINDLDELKSVLQSSSQASLAEGAQTVAVSSTKGPTTVASSEQGSSRQPSQPFNYLVSQTPKDSSVSQPIKANINSKLSKSVPDLASNQLVDISSGENVNDNVVNPRSVSPPTLQNGQFSLPSAVPTMGYGIPSRPFSYLHGVQNNSFSSPTVQQNNPVLVDVNSSVPVLQVSLPSSLPPISTTPSSLISGSQTAYPMAGGNIQEPSNIRLPPLRKPPPIPPRLSGRKIEPSSIDNVGSNSQNAVNVGVSSSYLENTEVIPVSGSSGQDMARSSQTSQSKDSSRRHSTPLPPIPSSSPPPQPSSQSTLPDPTPVLTESEKRFVDYIGIMGFPMPRIARAVQRLGEKDKEVIDFLVIVEKLTEEGFPDDDVEIALSLFDDDEKKALEFLKLSESFKQLGFEEPYIQEALKAADNDHDKALDFLTSISAS